MVVMWSRPYIAFLAIYCMIPGAGEIVENVVHLVENGHTAHALNDADHERQGAEHGCSGTSHVCSCCQTPAFMGAKLIAAGSPNPFADSNLLAPPTDVIADGFLSGVFRPPIA